MSEKSNAWKWLWLCLFLFQMLQFAIFYGLLHTQWMHDKMVWWAILSVLANLLLIKRLLILFSWNPDDYSPLLKSKWVRWNAIAAAGFAIFLPVTSLLLCETPWRYFPDGPLQGPMPVTAITDNNVRGVIEFSSGHALHDFGWGIEVIGSRFTEVTYVDPFVDQQWATADPIQVWVAHSEYEELTAEHRFGYVVSEHYSKRTFWNSIIDAALEQHELQAPDDRLIVTLSTQGPRFPQGPLLMQFVFGLYFSLGLYLGIIAFAFGGPAQSKPAN